MIVGVYLFEGNLSIDNINIPKTVLGSDPFLRAPHFGHRATLYELDLYNKPEEVFKVIKKSYDLGVKAIEIKNQEFLIEAVNLAKERGLDLEIIGIISKDYEGDVKSFELLGSKLMLLDDKLTDSHNFDLIEEVLKFINEKDVISGLSTAFPFETTKKLLDSSVKDLFKVYMFPLNELGYMMDSQFFLNEQKSLFRKMIQDLDKINIASRVLATGIQNPTIAFEFLKKVDYVDMLTVGIAYEKEAQETWSILFEK